MEKEKFYDIPGQCKRARQINKLVIDLHRKDIDENFRPEGEKWLIGGSEKDKGGLDEYFYFCSALWNYDDSYGELTEKIRPYYSELSGFGPFEPVFCSLALVRNYRALTPKLREDFEQYVLTYMPMNLEEVSDFIGVNDNTPALIAAGLILGGEYFGKKEWMEKGIERLHHLRNLLNRRGFLSEYNSPTYIPVTLYALAAIVNYAGEKKAVKLALSQEKKIWKKCLAFYHEAASQAAGPYARAYRQDKLARTYNMRFLMYALLGEACGINPLNTIFAGDPDENYYWHISNAFIANMVYHCPAEYVEELFQREYPYVIRGTAETSASADNQLSPPLPGFISSVENLLRDPFPVLQSREDCYEYSAGVIDIYSYIDRQFAMGTASRDWHNGVQSDGFHVLYAEKVPARKQEQVGTIFANYTVNGSDCLDGDLGRKVALQEKTTAMVLYHPKFMAEQVTEAALTIVFGNHRMIRKIRIGGREITAEAIRKDGILYESKTLCEIYAAVADFYIMLVPLIAEYDTEQACMELESREGNLIWKLYNYKGEPRSYARKGFLLLTNGLVCEFRKACDYESFEDFIRKMGNFTVTQKRRANIHTRYAAERECIYQNGKRTLACCYSPITDGIQYMTVNGKVRPQTAYRIEKSTP